MLSTMKHGCTPPAVDTNPSSQCIRILIADDFPEWRTMIRTILSSRPEWKIIAEAGDGQQAVEKAIELRPDLVLLDIGMPVMNGLQAAIGIRQHCPGAYIIFVSQTNDEAVMRGALDLGPSAYVLKANAARDLVALIAAAQEVVAAQGNRRGRDLADGAVPSGVPNV